ncbi:hypothetical protein FOA43_002138 [Brettanomyces nanus]|uniref:DNA repair protein RAD5 n=1 Tax=Eeniella nana TaxID=13502 RepID=A0A875S410_EENNA|nr:uncharacterized protein FOA43_002138 [Brettanomyces nanus]QPG74802.1 hypothetical protein FOA43_002138 [Brettanomyces nanus]
MFFDHSLQTTTEPIVVLDSDGDDSEPSKNVLSFAEFKAGISAALGQISEMSIHRLYDDFLYSAHPLEKAANAYLDSPDVYQITATKRKQYVPDIQYKKKPKTSESTWQRYIGTIEIDCWCTRTTLGSASIGETKYVTVTHPGHFEVVYVDQLDEKTGYKREIGRFNESAAHSVGLLLQGHYIDLILDPVYLPDGILHIGDTFIMQADCFVTSVLFPESVSSQADAFTRAFSGSKGDKSLDDATIGRRSGVLRLFDLVQLQSPQLNKGHKVVSLGQNLELDQLRDLYKSTQSNSLESQLPETEPCDFNLTLRPYQKHGLSWMLQREGELEEVKSDTKDDNEVINPLWREYRWPIAPKRITKLVGERDGDSNSFYLNLYDGSCSVEKPVIRSDCMGGILADEMGLGKTITTLSLVLKCPMDSVDTHILPNYAYGTTLIVVPMALLSQWEKEFNRVNNKIKNRCFIYYGADTIDNLKGLLCQKGVNVPPTVILTTYGTIQSEWSRLETRSQVQGLFSVKFFRIILDEGHTIRNRSTKTAKASYSLKASRRWLLTGTPIVNRLEDLYSLIRFLEFEPWANHSLWKHFITAPFETGEDLPLAFNLLKSILDPILLRRTKNQRDKNGKLLVELPPKEVVIERLRFNEKEEVIYNWLKERAVSTLNENFRRGLLLKNYSSILTHLLRLRQVCDHIDLIKSQDQGDPDAEDKVVQQSITNESDEEALALIREIEVKEAKGKMSIEEMKKIKVDIYSLYPTLEGVECSICTGPIDIKSCVITECKHCFCVGCLKEHFDFQESHDKEQVLCPMCRSEIKKSRLFRTIAKQFVRGNDEKADVLLTQVYEVDRNYLVRSFDPYGKSSKINALISHLEQIKEESPGDHVIVFSQFTSFLDIVEEELGKYGNDFHVLKFDGRLGMEQRTNVLKSFEDDDVKGKNISVLLISLKAGGVGLNLTVASKAFLLDPHWNNAVEFQAIDRLHRVGQTKSVKVIRFIMQDSIEERMLEIQQKKNRLGEALTLNDEERRKKRIEEIQSLFKK